MKKIGVFYWIPKVLRNSWKLYENKFSNIFAEICLQIDQFGIDPVSNINDCLFPSDFHQNDQLGSDIFKIMVFLVRKFINIFMQ